MEQIQIELQQVSYSYEENCPVLRDITFSAGEQESIGLVGANGAGKSTLLKLLVGLNQGYQGSIRVGELPVTPKNLSKVREKTGYVFQDSENQLFMSKVWEDVAFAPRNYGLPEEEVKRRVQKALELVHLEHLRERHIHKLSGGEKKLTAIAAILSMTPDIILMDEPSGALDPRNRKNLIGILNRFHQLKIIASHDLDLILDTCDRVLLLSEGKIVGDGSPGEILTNQELLESHGLELPLSLAGRGKTV